MVANGTSVEAAAAETNLTPEQVNKWISEREKRKAAVRKRDEPEFAENCGQGIPFGMTYTAVGSDPYHNECYRKKFG